MRGVASLLHQTADWLLISSLVEWGSSGSVRVATTNPLCAIRELSTLLPFPLERRRECKAFWDAESLRDPPFRAIYKCPHVTYNATNHRATEKLLFETGTFL